MDVVNEKTTYRVVAEFIAEDGEPVIPVSGSYRLDDVLSGTELIGDSVFYPAGSQHVFTIPYTANTISNTANDFEEKAMTVTILYGTGKQATGEYRYKVKNLLKVV